MHPSASDPEAEVCARRRAGVLLHPTSLPGPRELGTLGREAERFVDFLAEAAISVWQMLPVGPTHGDRSPYRAQSIHAGNPALIDPLRLVEWGWLPSSDAGPERCTGRCVEAALEGFKTRAGPAAREGFEAFLHASAPWLDDYALYRAVRDSLGDLPWWEWPEGLRTRRPAELDSARQALAADIERLRFEQFVFARQWAGLREHARLRGVRLLGDMPIFVAEDSVDVWAQRHWFRADDRGRLSVVTGVPPDAFSATGQRWGNPHYHWQRMADSGFQWWKERVRTDLSRFDWIRIDHFRGFAAAWEVPAESPDAREGRWVEAPGHALFSALQHELGPLPFVAEDLGYITPDVHALREAFGLPGMKVLQFAFDGAPDNPYLPHNHIDRAVIYLATHDNDTTRGWLHSLPPAASAQLGAYLDVPPERLSRALLRSAMASVGRLAVVTLQDLLELGPEARMNTPGTVTGNWGWRFAWDQLRPGLAAELASLVRLYGRAPA